MSLTTQYIAAAAEEAWPEVQRCESLPGLPGVYEVESAGHGGYVVSDELFDLHPALRTEHFRGASIYSLQGGRTMIQFYQFEEDADWAVLALYHPEVLAAINKQRAQGGYSTVLSRDDLVQNVTRWNPELLAGATETA